MNTPTLPQMLRSKGLKLVDLAREIKVDKATVTRWAKKRIPAERVLDVERLTGISKEELRPDLYRAEA